MAERKRMRKLKKDREAMPCSWEGIPNLMIEKMGSLNVVIYSLD